MWSNLTPNKNIQLNQHGGIQLGTTCFFSEPYSMQVLGKPQKKSSLNGRAIKRGGGGKGPGH